MFNLRETLNKDLKDAMKSKENFKRDCLRMIFSSIKKVEVDERRVLSNDDIIKILLKEVKQREDSARQYKEAKREDLYEKEIKEVDFLKVYLPKQLSDEDLESKIRDIIKKAGVSSIKDMGKVMGIAMKDLANIADGKRINEFVKKILNT